tara:strand:- start:716 stop:1693 length:978 start_codon:yes stop_codon:yes gene_type:complete
MENRIEFADKPQEVINPEGNLVEETPQGETTPESDPFEEFLVAEGIDSAAFNNPQESGQPVETDDIEQIIAPKADPEQHQYWQSQYDKVKGEFDSLNARYNDIRAIEPIANYINRNPKVLDVVEASLSAGNTPGQVQQQEKPQAEPAKRPERPTKPAEYDAIDAYSDPESKSYKYRESVDSYRDNMIEFQEERNNVMENVIVGERERQRQIMMQQQQAQQANNVHTQLTQGYGFSENEATDFMTNMSKPEAITMDNLVALYKMKQSPQGQVLANQRKAEEMRRQKEKLSIPSPVGVATAETPVETAIEDRVMDALIDDYKSQNPF